MILTVPPIVTIDRRSLVAVGCDEGVWIGLRHDPRSLRKVLHVKAVTKLAVLEEFGIFLVLQDKVRRSGSTWCLTCTEPFSISSGGSCPFECQPAGSSRTSEAQPGQGYRILHRGPAVRPDSRTVHEEERGKLATMTSALTFADGLAVSRARTHPRSQCGGPPT